MTKSKDTKPTVNNQTLLLLFVYGGRRYRMRVACVHIHPGESDCVEVSSTDMLGTVAWTAVPSPWQGSGPSAEWLIRRALWMVFNGGLKIDGNLMTVDIGEI